MSFRYTKDIICSKITVFEYNGLPPRTLFAKRMTDGDEEISYDVFFGKRRMK